MNRLRVKCIRCGAEWEKDSAVDWGPSDFSSSLCTACFVQVVSPVIHRKQLQEGNFDCFGKAHRFCDQHGCKYRQWCLSEERLTDQARFEDPNANERSIPYQSESPRFAHPHP